MFGRGWEPGQATIVALKEIWSIGNDPITGQKLRSYDYVADVQPDGGGAVFRTVLGEPHDETGWRQPSVGEVMPVNCDPGRQKAKFDAAATRARGKAQQQAIQHEQAARFDAAVHEAPGTTAPSAKRLTASRHPLFRSEVDTGRLLTSWWGRSP